MFAFALLVQPGMAYNYEVVLAIPRLINQTTTTNKNNIFREDIQFEKKKQQKRLNAQECVC